MSLQFSFFDQAGDEHNTSPILLEGLRYQPALISPTEEDMLLAHVRELPFQEFDFHGYKGKRRVFSFGWQYDYSGRRLSKTEDIPDFLLKLRSVAASFAELDPAALQQALVTEYGPGVGIGWHRDKAVFGEVIGISLLSPCVLRFRRKVVENFLLDRRRSRRRQQANEKQNSEPLGANEILDGTRVKENQVNVNVKRGWERVNVLAEPRSAYFLSGPARSEWEHSILRVDALRYSITFREVREQ